MSVTFPICTADCSCAAGCGAGAGGFPLPGLPADFAAGGGGSEGEQEIVAGAALLHPVRTQEHQAGMAGPAQAGENLAVAKRGKELIALYRGVLRRRLGVDLVDVQPARPPRRGYVRPPGCVAGRRRSRRRFARPAPGGWSIRSRFAGTCPLRDFPAASSPHRPRKQCCATARGGRWAAGLDQTTASPTRLTHEGGALHYWLRRAGRRPELPAPVRSWDPGQYAPLRVLTCWPSLPVRITCPCASTWYADPSERKETVASSDEL